MVIEPRDYQLELADKAYKILKDNLLVYLAMEERTGKSLIGLLTLEKCSNVNRVLIITKKNAISGWQDTINNSKWLKNKCDVINYHSCKKVRSRYDAVILDESHTYISGYPKTSKLWNDVKAICMHKPIIYMSATPYAQGMQLLYHQFKLSTYSPWKKYSNFYAWYNKYAERDKNGDVDTIWISGRAMKTYKKMNSDIILPTIKHLFIHKTRKSLGFKQEPKDILHYIELSDVVKKAYNMLLKDRVLIFENGDKSYDLIADSNLKLRSALHMLEGGAIKIDNTYIALNSSEKIDYIIENWGDSPNLAIMYNYIAEGNKLRSSFKEALILQGTSYAEGIDLSHIKNLVIYSQDFSTSKHTQRRARQTGKNRNEPINVHFLLVKKAISSQVYKAVSKNKTNFVDSLFIEETI